MRIAVTGATGFIGRHVVRLLLSSGYEVRVLGRRVGDYNGLENVSATPMDLSYDTGTLGALDGCDAVIHLAGIFAEGRRTRFDQVIRVGTELLLTEARRSGVSRFIYVSARGASASARSKFLRAKRAAEEAVREGDLDWTVVRPSLVYGPGDHIINRLAGLLRLPFAPLVGDGTTEISPIHVDDVARILVAALEQPSSIGRTVVLRGPEVMPFHSLVDVVEDVSFKLRRPRVHFPAGLVRLVARFLAVVPGDLLTRERVALFTDPPGEDGATVVIGRVPLRADVVREYLHPAGTRRRIPREEQAPIPDDETVAALIRNGRGPLGEISFVGPVADGPEITGVGWAGVS
jgi:NADH dehydrogenase